MSDKLAAATKGMTERAAALYHVHAKHIKDGSTTIANLRVRAQGRYVPGVGDVEDPILVLVGEAPGRTEHNTGRPFAGPSGRVLTDMMNKIGLPRERCYITNAVKYRPADDHGHNRTPTPDEVSASRPYLLDEIRIVRPQMVVTLGNIPMQAIIDKEMRIGACHGMVTHHAYTRVEPPVMTMYHPAFGVYQKRNLPQMEQDWEGLALVLTGMGVEW